MGSFWGHVDEGLFFIVIAFWWMVHAFREYIVAESQGRSMRPNIHYDVVIKRPLPIEIVFKILFPIVGFLGEFFDGGVRFQDANGNFVKLIYQQHMTIYGIFIIHGITDLMAWFKAPIIPNFNYMTAFLSFMWYGVAFYYHASMHGKEPVETIVHILPIYVMFFISAAILLEIKWREGVWTMAVRAYGVLTLGTWFSHVAFMLYVHDRFPGGEESNLDRNDPNNVVYVKAMFGLHLLANLVISFLLYGLVYVTLKFRLKISIQMPKYGLESEKLFLFKPKHYKRLKTNSSEVKGHDTSSEDSSLLMTHEGQAV
ncbi:transmembrane protein 45B-like [Biomphalaria glabrata]|uniref:Transmembrane protein 45B-like n=1 Tax=Biomphalaria glabrata TaxID=6526 RepID=A0A9W2YEW1_BIOGL|nr:transmembrane protein 45B-like [Biomphalaria glabrata]KAI8782967.1 transmembrane protein 45B [Biomphalaria glabrata]